MRNHIFAGIVFMAVLFVFPAGYSPAQDAGTSTTIVNMTNTRRFEPDSVTINPGDTVEWRNVSGADHTVTTDSAVVSAPSDVSSPPGAQTFNSGTISAGGRFMYTFSVPGTYRYVCLQHESEGMDGEVIVRQEAAH